MTRPLRSALALSVATVTALALSAPALAHDDKPQLPPLEIPDGHLGTPFVDGVEYVGGRNGFTGGHVVLRGDRLYIGSFAIGMRIYDISDRESPELLGAWQPAEPRADAVPEAGEFDGRHLAVLNGTRRTTRPDEFRTDRSEFLDVTDPAEPVLLHEFVGQDDGEAHLGHFLVDQRVWVPAGGSLPYGEDGGAPEERRPDQSYDHHGGLRLYDLSPVIETDPGACDGHGGWDNPCAPELLFAADPVAMWEASPHRGDREVGHDFTHTHDATPHEGVEVAGLDGPRDIVLLAEGGDYLDDAGNTGSIFVIDVTGVADGQEPVVLNRFIHPGYEDDRDHDPIRYYHEAQLLDGDPSVMMITDEDMHSGCEEGGAIYFVALSADLTEAEPLSEWHIPSDTPAAVCSVHNISSDGDLVYVGSYDAGLQVLDLSDPTEPERAGYFIAEGATTWGAYHYDGYVYLGDMTRGLDIVRALDQPDGTGEGGDDGADDGTADGGADDGSADGGADDGTGDGVGDGTSDDGTDGSAGGLAAEPARSPLPTTGGPAGLTVLGLLLLTSIAGARRRAG
jgi:hypothetical protein